MDTGSPDRAPYPRRRRKSISKVLTSSLMGYRIAGPRAVPPPAQKIDL
jgi:hypothetical protein